MVDAAAAADTLAAAQDAVAAGDAAAAEAVGAGDGADLLSAATDNVAALRLDDVTFRYLTETGDVRDDAWSALVEVTWRYAGLDGRAAARAEVPVEFTDGGAAIADIGSTAGAPDGLTPLWLQGPVSSRRGPDTLVLTTGPEAALDDLDRQARAALSVVRRTLGLDDPHLVVEVPDSTAALDVAVGADPGTYDAVAAVTTSVDGSHAPGSPVHVFVNPAVYGDLDELAAQVVMTHEAVHVVTEAPLAVGVPPWLLEGFADYVALRDAGVPVEKAAGQVLDQVREDGLPSDLPGPVEFDTGGPHLGAAYEAAWLACVTLADHGGDAALVAFYDDVLAGTAVDEALDEHFGWTPVDLVAAWRERLAGLAGVRQ